MIPFPRGLKPNADSRPFTYGLKPVPFRVHFNRQLQGLKPFRFGGFIGTTKVVPFQSVDLKKVRAA